MKRKSTKFQPGQSGNPKGRPKGAKNKLSENFLQALSENFKKHGKEAIETVCRESPSEYLRIIAGLMPKELLLEVSQEEKPHWVINAQPLSVEDWAAEHGIKTIESSEPLKLENDQ